MTALRSRFYSLPLDHPSTLDDCQYLLAMTNPDFLPTLAIKVSRLQAKQLPNIFYCIIIVVYTLVSIEWIWDIYLLHSNLTFNYKLTLNLNNTTTSSPYPWV